MPRKKTSHRARWGTTRRQKSGNFSASYRHGGVPGVVESVEYFATHTFETEADARVWLATERRLIDTGNWTPPADRVAAQRRAEQAAEHVLTLGEYARAWLDRSELRPTSRARYGSLLRYYILAEPVPSKAKDRPGKPLTAVGLGDAPLSELTRAQVAEWWYALPLKSRRPSCDQAYALLRAILNDAKDEELLDQSPARVKGAGKPSAHRRIQVLTPAQVEAIADAMPTEWRLGVLLCTWCALRIGEVRELRRRDVDAKQGTITVARSVSSGLSTLTVGDPKSEAGHRTVAIPLPLLDDVRQHLRERTQLGPSGLLFWDAKTGRQVAYPRWRAAFVAAGAAAGLEGVRTHDLRHVGLTHLATAGATVRELQAVAGHTSSASAMRYQAVANEHMAEVTGRFGDIIQAGRKET